MHDVIRLLIQRLNFRIGRFYPQLHIMLASIHLQANKVIGSAIYSWSHVCCYLRA